MSSPTTAAAPAARGASIGGKLGPLVVLQRVHALRDVGFDVATARDPATHHDQLVVVGDGHQVMQREREIGPRRPLAGRRVVRLDLRGRRADRGQTTQYPQLPVRDRRADLLARRRRTRQHVPEPPGLRGRLHSRSAVRLSVTSVGDEEPGSDQRGDDDQGNDDGEQALDASAAAAPSESRSRLRGHRGRRAVHLTRLRRDGAPTEPPGSAIVADAATGATATRGADCGWERRRRARCAAVPPVRGSSVSSSVLSSGCSSWIGRKSPATGSSSEFVGCALSTAVAPPVRSPGAASPSAAVRIGPLAETGTLVRPNQPRPQAFAAHSAMATPNASAL